MGMEFVIDGYYESFEDPNADFDVMPVTYRFYIKELKAGAKAYRVEDRDGEMYIYECEVEEVVKNCEDFKDQHRKYVDTFVVDGEEYIVGLSEGMVVCDCFSSECNYRTINVKNVAPLEYGEKLELMRSEVRRLLKEYENSEVCWWEMASDIHLDPRLDLEAQVNVYAQVFKEIDGDEIRRFTTIDDEEECAETYGVDMAVYDDGSTECAAMASWFPPKNMPSDGAMVLFGVKEDGKVTTCCGEYVKKYDEFRVTASKYTMSQAVYKRSEIMCWMLLPSPISFEKEEEV